MAFDPNSLIPRNQLLADMASEHRKIIHGAVYDAVRHITGKDVDQADLVQHLGLASPDHGRHVDYVYRGHVILRVYRPEFRRIGPNTTKVFQRVDQIWKRKNRFKH